MYLVLVFRHQPLQGQQKFRLLLRVQGTLERFSMRLNLCVFQRDGLGNENLGVLSGNCVLLVGQQSFVKFFARTKAPNQTGIPASVIKTACCTVLREDV
jgi:hypothetical protein